ncbi:MAG TPA: serine/threonine-protein kinase, partial [Labilithrix sp.]
MELHLPRRGTPPAPHPSMTVQVDTQSLLARRYALGRTLGSAGMGIVYEATDVVTRQRVAVKVLKKVTVENVRRLQREAEIGKAFANDYVRRVYDYGVERDSPYLVMELLEGEPLSARVRASGGLAAGDAIAVGLQLLEALDAAHAVGIMHRDVKPANVFVTSAPGKPLATKLFDFGLARKIRPTPRDVEPSEDAPEEDTDTNITATGIVPGTPRYLTPEQLSGARDLDARVDVWAAALTLYEALAGKPAYRGSTD